jgi:hypothetical protein
MRDYEVDLEPRDERRSRRPNEPEEAHAEIGHAIEARRPDVVGTTGLLHMQRMAGNNGVASFIAQREEEQSPVKSVIRSEGSPLDSDTKSEMEARLGHDFDDVRVHADGQATASAKSVHAHAYTVGNHVVFGEGTYEPSSDQGKRTLAHELTHVVQQRSGPVDGTPAPGGISLSHPSDRFEQEADRSADAAMAAPLQSSGPEAAPAPAAAVQRDSEEENVQGLFVQRQGEAPAEEEEEEPVSKLDASVQRQGEEEEEEAPPA